MQRVFCSRFWEGSVVSDERKELDRTKEEVGAAKKRRDELFIVCELGSVPLDADEMEMEKIKFCRNPKDWRCGCGH